jgi:branched-chain amino acid transport system substrate-binding protein
LIKAPNRVAWYELRTKREDDNTMTHIRALWAGPGRLRRLPLVLVVIALAALTAAGCGDDDDDGGGGGGDGGGGQASADCTGSIGVMAPITGDAAELGEEQRNWARFGLDRFNKANGTKFKMVEGDTQLDPGQASTVAQQFVSDDAILGVVGPAGSQEVEAVGPLFDRASLAFVSQSATQTDLTESGDYPSFSRVVPKDSVQGPTDAQYMIDELGAKNVLIVDDQTSYSTGLAEVVEKELKDGGVTVSRESVNQDSSDFSAIVSKVGADTDVVFLPWQIAPNAEQLGQQMAEQNKDAVIFGSDGLFSPGDFTIDGSFVSAFAPDINSIPESRPIAKAYTEEYGEFGTFGPPTYAAVEVVATAIQAACEEGDPTREAVTDQIRQVNLQESILGQPIVFDENGDLEDAEFFIFTIKDGSFELTK